VVARTAIAASTTESRAQFIAQFLHFAAIAFGQRVSGFRNLNYFVYLSRRFKPGIRRQLTVFTEETDTHSGVAEYASAERFHGNEPNVVSRTQIQDFSGVVGDDEIERPLDRFDVRIHHQRFTPHKAGDRVPVRGAVQVQLKRYAAALAARRRSLAILEKSVGPDHPNLAWPLAGIGEALLAQGLHREAVTPLERALALRESAPIEEIAEVEYLLAQALWPSRPHRARARKLATSALARYRQRGVGLALEQAAEIERWLADRR